MKKFSSIPRWLRFLTGLYVVFLIAGFLFISVDFVALNRNFYENQFRKNNTAEAAELSNDELSRVLDKLLDYFSGKTDDLQIEVTFLSMDEPSPFYTEDELSHMKDVKNVFRGFRFAGILLFLTGLAGLFINALLTEKKMLPQLFSRGAIAGSIVFLSTVAVLGILILLFFEPLFNMFHQIFFPQGNWQFPWDSKMLAILPESLFQNAAIYIAVSGLSFALIILASGITVKILLKKKQAQNIKE